MRNLALVEILPRRDEVSYYKIVNGQFEDLSETPAPKDQVVAVRQWDGPGAATGLRFTGERNSPQLRRARVLAIGPQVSDITPGDTVLVGIFAGLEAGLDDKKDIRWITEKECLLLEND